MANLYMQLNVCLIILIGDQNVPHQRFGLPQFLLQLFGSLPQLWHATLS
jgi:hypothetical protein